MISKGFCCRGCLSAVDSSSLAGGGRNNLMSRRKIRHERNLKWRRKVMSRSLLSSVHLDTFNEGIQYAGSRPICPLQKSLSSLLTFTVDSVWHSRTRASSAISYICKCCCFYICKMNSFTYVNTYVKCCSFRDRAVAIVYLHMSLLEPLVRE